MIIKTYFKTPDAVKFALHDAVEQEMLTEGCSMMDDGWDIEYERRAKAAEEKLKDWIKFNECVWIEFDTEKNTATVVRQ